MTEGPRVPGYDDLRVLGRGGFATVYRARQTSVGRDVALKVLDGASTDPRRIELFTRECTAVGSLSWHPHVVPVYDAGRTPDGMAYLAMELLPGGSLGDRLEAEGPLPLAVALGYAADVADALAAAHEVGVLHRDVKPANVLVDRRGRARLADFGIARVAGTQTTTDGAVTGTIAYLAPEVLAGGRATTASDVWALGLTLAALLGGRNPLVVDTDDTPFAIIARIVSGPTDTVPPGLPRPVADLVASCTARDPEQRPAGAAEVHEVLVDLAQAAASGSLTTASGAGAPPPVPPPPPRPPDAAPGGRTGVPAPPTSAVRIRPDHTLAKVPPPPPPSPPPPPPPRPPEATTAQVPEPGPPDAPPTPAGRSRRVLLVAVAVLAVLAGIAGAAVLVASGGGEADGDDDADEARPGTEQTAAATTGGPATGAALPLLTPGALTVCAPGGARPFSYVEGGTVTGFDVDLLGAMAQTLDLELQLPEVGEVFDGPNAGVCDVAVGGWTITPEREEGVDFTTSYLQVDQSLLTLADAGLDDESDLSGLTVGVTGGSTGEELAVSELGVEDPVALGDPAALVDALLSGEIDAAVLDGPFSADAAFEDDRLVVAAKYPTNEDLGFVLAEGSTELVAALDDALATVRDDGTYEEIRSGYFGG